MQTFSFVFLSVLALTMLLRYWLALRHVRHIRAHRGSVPQEFADRISLESHHKAADYSIAKTRLGNLTFCWKPCSCSPSPWAAGSRR